MSLLGTVLRMVAVPIAVMALLIGFVMVTNPDSIEAGLIPLVFCAALAGACWAVGSRLRRAASKAAEWEEGEPDEREWES